MNRQNSRVIALLMAVIMAFTAIPLLTVSAGAATASIDSTGKILTISGSGKMTDYSNNMQAPYYNNKEIEKVIVSDGITHIGNYYFCNMPNLKEVEFPASLKTIGNSAFYNCPGIESVTLSAVESIGDYAFYYCYGLKTVEFGNSLEKIGDYAFAQCSEINNVVIPEPCEKIGSFAFAWCHKLTTIELPVSLKKLGDNVFNGSNNLTEIYYSGTEDQFNRISMGSGNENIKSVIRFNDTLPVSETYGVLVTATNKNGKTIKVKGATVSVYDNSNGQHTWLYDKTTNSFGIALISTDGLNANQIKNLTVSAYIVDNIGSNISGDARNDLFEEFGTTSSGDPIRFIYELHSETVDYNGNWNGQKLPADTNDPIVLKLSEPRLKVNLAVSYLEDPSTPDYEQRIKKSMSLASELMAQSTDGHIMFNKVLLVPTDNRADFGDTNCTVSMADIQIQTTLSEGKPTDGVVVHSNASAYGFYTSDTQPFSTSSFKLRLNGREEDYDGFNSIFSGHQNYWRAQFSGYEGAYWYNEIGTKPYSTTIVHELGHYLLGFFDEYMNANAQTWRTSNRPYENFGLMDGQHKDIELSRDSRDYKFLNGQHHNTNKSNETYQSWANEKSCEQQIADMLTDSHKYVNDDSHNSFPYYNENGKYIGDSSFYALEGEYSFKSGNYQGNYTLSPSDNADRTADYPCASLKNNAFKTISKKTILDRGTGGSNSSDSQNTADSNYASYVSDSQKIIAYIYNDNGAYADFVPDEKDYSFNEFNSIDEAVSISTMSSDSTGEIYGEISNDLGIDFSSISWFRYSSGKWEKVDTDISRDSENLHYKVRCDFAGDGLYVIMAKPANTNPLREVSVTSYKNSTVVDGVSEITINDPNNADDIIEYAFYYSEKDFASSDENGVMAMVEPASGTTYTVRFDSRDTDYYVKVIAIGKDGATSPSGSSFKLTTGAADKDNDGIPDWYCDKYHLWGEDDSKDIANSDENGNGLTNLEEYLAGNDPTAYEEKKPDYTVKFTADGSDISEKKYTEGEVIVKPADPVKAGYTFKGWNPEVPAAMPANDITFVALFEKNSNPVIPDLEIKNYQKSLNVSYKSKLVFHTNIEAPEGYEIVWSDGQKGSTFTVNNAINDEYRISARLMKDGKAVKSTQEETVYVENGFFARILTFFRILFGKLPVYIDNIKQ